MSKLLNPLAGLAKRFKGFLGFAAFVLLVIVVLFLWLFSSGSFDPLIESLSQLEREQFFWFAMTALVLLFLSVLFLVILAYKSSPLPSGDREQAVVYVVVHEKGDKTRVISDAEVILALPEPVRKSTQNSGSASFTIPEHFIGREISFNARKPGYRIRRARTMTLKDGADAFIPLERESGYVRKEPLSKDVSDSRKGISVAGSIPRPHEFFVGRDEELLKLMNLLQENAVVAIGGVPGIGKTDLASAFARRLKDLGYSPLWIECGEGSGIEDIVAVMGSYSEQIKQAASEWIGRRRGERVLQEFLPVLDQVKRCVVFLEQAEKVSAEELKEFVTGFLDHCELTKLVLVTRELPARIKTLPRIGLLLVCELAKKEGFKYLCLELEGEEPMILEKIYCATAGHPLAMCVFVGLAKDGVPVQVLLDDPRYWILETSESEVKLRFEEAYSKWLDDDTRLAAGCISVLDWPFRADAVQHMYGRDNWRDVLLSLLSKYIIRQVEQERFKMHELVKQFFYGGLQNKAYHHSRAAEYYLKGYSLGFNILHPESEVRNKLEAHKHLVKAHQPEEAARTVLDVKRSLTRLGWYDRLSGLVDDREFGREACRILRREACRILGEEEIERPIMAVFLGAGDLAHGMIRELRKEKIPCVAIDGKISVGWVDADYQFLNEDKGLRDTEWVVRMLQDIVPENVRQLLEHLKPILIGEYHGFDVGQVFSEAESIGYRVVPNKKAAALAMDKVEFWEYFRDVPEIAKHLLPQIAFPSLPTEIVRNLREGWLDNATERFIERARSDIEAIGLPCVFKAAISEFGYAQSVVHKAQEIRDALVAMVKQADARRVNPNNRFVVQKYIPKPLEMVQVVVRHLDMEERPQTTCLPPIWNTVVSNRNFGGPFVFEDVFQFQGEALPEIQQNRHTIEAISKRIVELLGNALGVYGVELFVKDGNVWINRLSVRTQDTMLVTKVTSEQNNCFQLFAKAVLGTPVDPSEIQTLQYSGATRALLWDKQYSALLDRFEGIAAAKALSGQYDAQIEVDVYSEKRRLRPLRRMGTISVQVPKEVSLEVVQNLLAEASARVKIIPRPLD